MFVELLPLLAKRSLAITMCATSATDVQLTIQPKPTDKAEKVPDPYVASGPATDVDASFVSDIAGYTKTVLAFYSSLEEVKASTEATLKEVKEDSAKKVAEAKKTGKIGTSAVKPTPAPAKPEPVKAPEPPSLFDAVPAPAPVAAVTPAPAPAAVVAEPVAEPVAASDGDDDNPDTDSCCAVSEEEEEEEEEEEATAATEQVAAYAMASGDAPEAQSSMFARSSWENEEEILKEAFHHGDQNWLIAA
jgi:PRTRC genetic system protein E